jgi:hypothetical protein
MPKKIIKFLIFNFFPIMNGKLHFTVLQTNSIAQLYCRHSVSVSSFPGLKQTVVRAKKFTIYSTYTSISLIRSNNATHIPHILTPWRIFPWVLHRVKRRNRTTFPCENTILHVYMLYLRDVRFNLYLFLLRSSFLHVPLFLCLR